MRRAYLLALLAVTGCSLEANAEMKELCITQKSQEFPGVAGVSGEFCTPTSPSTLCDPINIDLKDLADKLSEQGVTGEARVLSVTFASSTVDLSQIQSLKVRLVPSTGSSLAPTDIINYPTTSGTKSPSQLVLTGGGLDLWQYLKANQLNLTVSGSGTLPATNWTADLGICVGMKLTIDEWKLITQ
jgi:hypothetical protein